jgi:DnaJ domain.
MKKENLGCCSMVLWDILLIIVLICTLMPNSIHVVFRILIGFVCGILFMVILNIPYIGKIISVLAGLFWAYFVWELFSIGTWKFVAGDPVWKWAIGIILAIACVVVHMASFREPEPDFVKVRFSNMQKEERYSEPYEKAHQWNKQKENYYQRQQYQEQQYKEQQYQQAKSDNSKEEFDVFAGCQTKESVTRRYKDLCKSYHPDSVDGDTEQMQKLNHLYEEKLTELK